MSELTSIKKIPEFSRVTKDIFFKEILPGYQPAVLKGFFSGWNVVQAGKQSLADLIQYLLGFDEGREVDVFLSSPTEKGQFFYDDNLRGFNFKKIHMSLENCLTQICFCLREKNPPAIYMGSTLAESCLPGMMKENVCNIVDPDVAPRLWIGNETVVQPHFDLSDNIAVVAAGHRKFTLFPPEQIDNLYVGPIDVTPAGQPMSMVSLTNPDFEKYPRYREALNHAMVAELEPGDAIYIPSLWWHGVQALDKFNILVNYWWNNSAAGNEDPYTALVHGILTISSLPEKERMAWKSFFEHYVFRSDNQHPLDHLPSEIHGVLGGMTPEIYEVIRSYLYSRMKK